MIPQPRTMAEALRNAQAHHDPPQAPQTAGPGNHTQPTRETYTGILAGLKIHLIKHATRRKFTMSPITPAAAREHLAELDLKNREEFGSVTPDQWISAQAAVQLADAAEQAAQQRAQQAASDQQKRATADALDRAQALVAADADGLAVRASYTDLLTALDHLRRDIAAHDQVVETARNSITWAQDAGVPLPPNTSLFGTGANLDGHGISPAGEIVDYLLAGILDSLSGPELGDLVAAQQRAGRNSWTRPQLATSSD